MKTLNVSEQTHKRITKEKKAFQKAIGGGRWTQERTIKELFKVLDGFNKERKQREKVEKEKKNNRRKK